MKRLALVATTTFLATLPLGAMELSTTEWRLRSLSGADVTAEITLSLGGDGALHGKAPCNRYFGKNAAQLPKVQIDGLGSTRMACPELDLEGRYLEALQSVHLAEITGESLILSGDKGVTLEFLPLEPQE